MSENSEILNRLRFAGDHGFPLRVLSANGKRFTIQVTGIEEAMVQHRFSNGNEGKIRISNILSCEFTDQASTGQYEEWRASRCFHVEKPGERLKDRPLQEELILLLQQSNLSQKRAVKAALGSRVSVIEGPPGTGKTTTILSIIANMVYRGQKVLVVSKNNSAIDNVAEELDGMNLPEFYIRMGNEQVMKAAGAGKLGLY